ncbi:MAG: UDP-N-acetylmuramate dehydrogenase [Bacillota bacterium]
MQIEQAYRALQAAVGDESRVLRDEPMNKHTSFKIGGPADIMICIKSADEIADALRICRRYDVPVTVIGNGTNLLVRDKGIRGAVIKIGKEFCSLEIAGTHVTAQAGILVASLANQTLNQGLAGLEFACGIPGTLGGAVMMNAGAYGGEIADCLKRVRYMDESGNTGWKLIQKDDLGYRRSIFSETGLIVLEAEFELRPDESREAQKRAQEISAQRNARQPVHLPSAGSTFKRPHNGYAARLIDQAGLKGLRVGGAQVSELHAGFIVNTGGATAEDVLELAETVRARVLDASGTDLELEIKVLGEE